MKKYLLISAVMMAAVSASAQKMEMQKLGDVNKQVGEFRMMAEQTARPMAVNPATLEAPKKAAADGVYYARPKGTFWLTSTSAAYLVVPPFTDLTFKNLSDETSSTSWTLGTTDLAEKADADNNLVYNWGKIDYGYVGYTPVLSNGKIDYSISDYIMTVDSVPQVVYPFNYLTCPRYYGYSTGESAFQSGDDVFDWDEDGVAETFKVGGFLQYFEKPASSMLLHDVVLWSTTPNPNVDVTNLKLKVYKWERDEEGYRVLGDLVKVLDCSSANYETETIRDGVDVYPGTLVFAAVEKDDFGTPTAVPFLIDFDYALVLDVSAYDNTDLRFYFTNQGGYKEEMTTWASPTFIQGYDKKTQELLGNLSYYQNTASNSYCYNLAYIFEIEMDAIEVTEGTELQTAPVAGGESMVSEESPATYVWTNMPMYETLEGGELEWTGNYEFEGLPDWAEVIVDPTYYEYTEVVEGETMSVRGLHQVVFDVQALPEGVKGREATVYVKSVPFNLKASRAIRLVQGEVDDNAGVATMVYDANGKFVASYNLSGRKVAGNSKGLTIRDGKKFINK